MNKNLNYDTRQYSLDLSESTRLVLPVRVLNKYALILDWENVVGSGTCTILGGNVDKGPFIQDTTPEGSPISVAITAGTGETHIRNHVGHTDRLLVIDFVGLISGTVNVQINFTN